MVSYSQILTANALINEITAPHVAIFVSGTSGIGQLTLRALVATGISIRIYLVGRKSSHSRAETFMKELHTLNPRAEIMWTEAEVSLLSEVQRIAEIIKLKERHVDLLFLTTGYAPFGARRETSEGIEISQSLSYYSRILFILQLLPLLSASTAPRVVSVLHGGMESTSIDLDDMDLRGPGNFGVVKAHAQYGTMTTMTLDKLAAENPDVTFIHSVPGWVDTGNVWRGVDDPHSCMAWFIRLVLAPLIRLFAFSDEESGQRHLFQCTSAAFGGHGTTWEGKPGLNSRQKQENGLFLVSSKNDSMQNTKVIAVLQENGQETIWNHTMEVLGPFL